MEHKKYPYLLRDVVIDQPDQVWTIDITYIRLQKGSIYLVAIWTGTSRYVLTREISVTQDKEFCVRALAKALGYSAPEVFNSDRGSQLTSLEFTGLLESFKVPLAWAAGARPLIISSLSGSGE